MNSRFEKINKKILVLLILILSGFLRLYRLDTVPPSPYWEEVALGYDAYSIAETGKDHHGNSYPIIAFPSYGDYKPSGYFYAIVPFVKLLGLNVWSVRLPSAIAGIISVGLLYLIGKELFDETIAVTASLFLSISPWAIQFSRGGWEVNLAMMMILAGTALLVYSRRITWMLLPAVIFFCLSMYTYHAARLFAPLIGGMGGLCILFSWYQENKKTREQSRFVRRMGTIALAFIVALVFVAPFVVNLGNKEVSSRFSDTSIFSNPQPVLDSNKAIAAHGGSRFAKLLYHRYWYYLAIILNQWVSHFSPAFLFIHGDGNYRHGGWTSLLYPVDSLFLLATIGLLFLSFRKKIKARFALVAILFWIGMAALPPSLVTPAPHALRFLFSVPAFMLLVAYGVTTVFRMIPKKARLIYSLGLFAMYLYFAVGYWSSYLAVYPVKAQGDWQYGYESLYTKLGNIKKPGEQIYVSREMGRPAMYYLFYTSYDPYQLQKIEPTLPKDQLELLQVDDYHFVDGIPSGPGLYAQKTGTIVLGGKIVDSVEGLDGVSIWTIWRK